MGKKKRKRKRERENDEPEIVLGVAGIFLLRRRLRFHHGYPHYLRRILPPRLLRPVSTEDFLLAMKRKFADDPNIMLSGPIETSVLRHQRKHRSEAVWINADEPPLKGHKGFKKFWAECPLDVRVQEKLNYVGLYGVYMGGPRVLDWSLITALVERWRQETHTFHLPVGEATITLQDIQVLWGLPIHGLPICLSEREDTSVGWQDLCHELLGYCPPPEHFKGESLLTSSIVNHLLTHPLSDESAALEVEQHARCRMMQLISIIFGDHSGNKVKLMYLSLLANFNTARNYSWGSAALATLYRSLCRASKKNAKNLCGPVDLIQLWAWERLPKLRPTVTGFIEFPRDPNLPPGPRASIWRANFTFKFTGKHCLRSYRDQLDYLRDDEFIWQPYDGEIMEGLSTYCKDGKDIWASMVPLLNFEVVEFHLPNRVMRQFGYYQHVPLPVDTNDRLHKFDRRGYPGENWSKIHSAYISEWKRMRLNVLVGEHDNTPLNWYSPYMDWYRRITRILIGNPSHRLPEGFQPSAACLEYSFWGWVQVHNEMSAMMEDASLDDANRNRARMTRELSTHMLNVSGQGHRLTSSRGDQASSLHSNPDKDETTHGQTLQHFGRHVTSLLPNVYGQVYNRRGSFSSSNRLTNSANQNASENRNGDDGHIGSDHEEEPPQSIVEKTKRRNVEQFQQEKPQSSQRER